MTWPFLSLSFKGGAAIDFAYDPACPGFYPARPGKAHQITTAPHGSRCAGFPFAPGAFRGLFSICLICHFTAPVWRFSTLYYPYTAAVPLALCSLFMALWRGVVPYSVAGRLRGALPVCRRSCAPVALSGAVPCSGGVGRGAPVAASPCVALRQSRWHSRSTPCESRCQSRKCLRQSRSFYPKIIVVYKIPCINAGFFLPTFPELTESRAKVARFRLISHQSRWLLCTSVGAVQGSSPQSAAGSVSKPSPACPPCRNSSWHGSNMQGN